MIRHSIVAAVFAVASFAAFAAPSDTPAATPAPATAAAPAPAATGKPGAVAPKKAPSAAQTAQRAKMKDCSAQAKAKSLKGADRKAFMKTCLSAPAADATAAKP